MIDADLRDELGALLDRRAAFDEPLARATSLRVGGPADALVRVDDGAELAAVLRLCSAHSTPVLVLGAGFNTLVRDGGFRGVAVRLGGFREISQDGPVLRAGAGATHTQVTRAAAEAGLAGLEFAIGIPGTVGGWVAMNAGTREREMRDVLARVEWVTREGEPQAADRDALVFEYRHTRLPEGSVVTGARFALRPDDPERIRGRMREQMEARRASQPVDQPSCGSVFKNPPGDHAGRLIEASGLKGQRAGEAAISDLHANFIVTRPGARAADVLELIELARERVRERTGIELETEARIVGEPA